MVLIFTGVLISTRKLTRNKNHRFFWECWVLNFFGNLRVFSLRTMVLIKKWVYHQINIRAMSYRAILSSKIMNGNVLLNAESIWHLLKFPCNLALLTLTWLAVCFVVIWRDRWTLCYHTLSSTARGYMLLPMQYDVWWFIDSFSSITWKL